MFESLLQRKYLLNVKVNHLGLSFMTAELRYHLPGGHSLLYSSWFFLRITEQEEGIFFPRSSSLEFTVCLYSHSWMNNPESLRALVSESMSLVAGNHS